MTGQFNLVLFQRLYAAAASFVLTMLLGRVLGPEEFGAYVFAMGWLSIGILFTTLGFHHFAIRAIPPLIVRDRRNEVAGFIVVSSALTTGLAFAVAVLAWSLLDRLAPGADPAMEAALGLALLLLVPMTWNSVRTGFLQGLGHPVAGQVPERLVQPTLILLAVAGCWATGVPLGTGTVLLITLAATMIALAVGLIPLVPALRAVWRRPVAIHPRAWIAGAAKSSFLFAAAAIMGATDTVMLGQLSTASETGLYGVAARFFVLMALPLNAAAIVVSQRAAKLYAEGDIVGLERACRLGARQAFLSSLGLALVSTIAALNVTLLFGQGFEGATLPILVLVWTRTLVAVFGQPAAVLTNTAHIGTVSLVAAGFAVLNIGLNALLIPGFGANGAAIATAMSFGLMSLALAFLVLRVLGIKPYLALSGRVDD